MSVGTEIVAFLESNGLGTYEEDLFLGFMPETPDVCGAVFVTGGSGPMGGFGVPGILHENPGLMIRFRGAREDPDGPRTKAQQAYRSLATVQAMTLSGTKYLMIKPLQAPFKLEEDENRRSVWSFNALAEKELSVVL